MSLRGQTKTQNHWPPLPNIRLFLTILCYGFVVSLCVLPVTFLSAKLSRLPSPFPSRPHQARSPLSTWYGCFPPSIVLCRRLKLPAKQLGNLAVAITPSAPRHSFAFLPPLRAVISPGPGWSQFLWPYVYKVSLGALRRNRSVEREGYIL